MGIVNKENKPRHSCTAKTSYVPTTKLEDLAHNKVVKREFCNRTKKQKSKKFRDTDTTGK